MSMLICQSEERVCLVDEENREIGDCLKSSVHRYHTPLHRAFSVFIFNDKHQLLLQQRALSKLTWPGIWSNSCCGHPAPGEETADAASRRLVEELGLAGGQLFEALPDFRYRSRYLGIEENEICPVFIGRAESIGIADTSEVHSFEWMNWNAFLSLTNSPPTAEWGTLSPWSRWEAHLLEQLGPQRIEILMNLNPFNPRSI
jgi:isopentenyl-diphosphate delta-isomerase